jgi:integrase
MASFRKRGSGWEVFVSKHGQRASATFTTKAEAQAWAVVTEAEIIAGKRGDVPNKTFGQLLERYRDEVSPTKKGERWERLRIALVLRDEIAAVNLADLRQPDFACWRDRRLQSVSSASVRREWVLLSSACSIAVKEWHWLKDHPMRGVKVPAHGKARDRTATMEEIDRLCVALGYSRNEPPRSVGARVGAAMLFAIESAMRAGEIAALDWQNVHIQKRYLHVDSGKTDAASRDVPLSEEAIRLLRQMGTESVVFNLSTAQIDANFRKAKKMAEVEGLTFHDLRHTAITRLARKLDVLDLARMIGHRDLRMLMVYYNAKAEDIAGRLD